MSSNVQGTPKCKNIGTLKTFVLHPYLRLEGYQIVFQTYSQHTLRKYGVWARFPPPHFIILKKIVKIRTAPKSLKYKPVSWCRPTPYYRSVKYKSIMYLKVGNISYLFTMADKNEILAIVLHSCAIYSDRTNLVQNRGPTTTHLSRSQEFKKIRTKLQIQPKRECVGGGYFWRNSIWKHTLDIWMTINYNLFYQNYVGTTDLSNDISQYLLLIMKIFQKSPPPHPPKSNFKALNGVKIILSDSFWTKYRVCSWF